MNSFAIRQQIHKAVGVGNCCVFKSQMIYIHVS